MRTTRFWPALWLLSALNGFGCTTTTEGTIRSEISPEAYCRRGCAARTTCDASGAATDCATTCEQRFAAFTTPARADLLAYVATCIEATACDELEGAAKKCSSEALAVLSPSSIGNAFCASSQQANVNCQFAFDKPACFEAVKTYPDSAVNTVSECQKAAPCSALEACSADHLPQLALPEF